MTSLLSSSPDSGTRMRAFACRPHLHAHAQYRLWSSRYRLMKRPEIIMAGNANFKELGEPIHGGRAIAAILDGKTIGIAGYYLDKGRVVVYSKITPTLRLHKRTIIRGAMIIAGMVDKEQAPALALAEDGTHGSEASLG